MGVGSVACLPSQHIMERLSISETFRGGGNSNGKFNSKPLKVTERKMKMKVKREQLPKKTASKKDDFLGSEKKRGKKSSREFGCTPKEEIEEGELGEFIPEKLRKFELKSEIERGESPIERWRNGEVENGEFGWGKWRKDKREFSSGRSRYDDVTEKYKKGETEKEEFGSWRGSKTELEKGWHKSLVVKDEYRHSKMSRDDSDKGWRYEREWTPNGKYAGEKDFSRNGSRHLKRFSRWETGQERNPRVGSKIVDEEGSFKNEHRNGKYYERECISGNRLKRHGNDFESLDRKHYGEYGDYSSSKNRRLSDDGSRSAYSEHYSRQPVERSNRNSSSSRIISSGRYTSRHNESSLSSKVAYDKHGSSPRHSERSPRERARYTAHRDWSPVRRERSPYDLSRHYDHRTLSPSYSELSPQDRARSQDGRDQTTPNFLEHSLLDRGRPNIYREANKKIGASEKILCHRGKKGQEDDLDQKDPHRRDYHTSARESQDRSSLHNGSGSVEKLTDHQSQEEEQSQHQGVNCRESPQANGNTEELPSMEEDMDICDTPPHMPFVVDSTAGNWFYLDHFGVECGPSKLCDLKALVEEGFLVPDHLIKHLNSDRWIAVENAVSPLVTLNFSPIVSDTVTQLVSPPEASGNLLADVGETIQGEDASSSFVEPILYPEACLAVSEYIENLHIDKRVGALLEGYKVIPGQELETVGEVLQMKFEHGEWEKWGNSEGSSWPLSHSGEQDDQKTGDVLSRYPGLVTKETTDGSTAPSDRDIAFVCDDSSDWFSGRWSCKGGDWKRDDEASQDGSCKKKFVLNDGYPLCQMPKSGYEDPRWHEKDELYCPSHNRRLDLPPWAFSLPDEWNDCNGIGRSSQPKPVIIRGAKGTMLPVVRINACVVKDRGSFVSEPRVIVRGKDRYTSRSARPHSGSSDVKGSSEEGGSQSISIDEQASQGSSMSIASINIQENRPFAAENLKLHLGEWYYLDGAGHEQGPLSFSMLQLLADQGIIQKNSSVFRKIDRVWVPITSASETSELPVKIQQVIDKKCSDISGAALIESTGAALAQNSTVSSSFHSLHPQFIGFTRGKLHELVMKSYKSREFAAAINEVLDPWINAKQPKKDMEKYIHNPALYNKFSNPGKRARFLVDGSKEDYEMEEVKAVQEECTFDDLCSDAVFNKEDNAVSEIETGSWGLLDGLVLARVFHFLRTDVKSVVYAALTCKHWRAVSNFYKDITRQVDLSSVGPSCTDSMIWNIMTGYKEEKITSLVLLGCTDISSGMLEEIIRSFPSLSCIDIRGCNQFSDLEDKFLNINWVKSRGSHSKIRNLKHINEGTLPVFKSHNGLDTDIDDSSGLRDYFESLDRRDSANQLFHRSLYKRSKLLDARKSSSILSRNARLRRWAVKKSENGYKRMEEFLVFGLKDIMKENTFDFFVPKVAEIEDRMKNGYYAGRGLSTVKEDISRMCRDAIKAKNRGNTGDLNHIVTLFIRLATHLDDSYKSCHERDEMLKNWKADLPAGFWPTNSKYKKKVNKVTERKMIRTNGSSFNNGGSDYGEYASDREIRRRLSRLNKKSMVSRSETSDELDRSSEETKTDSESTSSDTDSNSDFRSESGIGESRGDGYFIAVDGLDSLTDDREWGARMTKASLVPPVTRKYEVIDRYVIVADDQEVKRKMQVSLPDDYDEKLSAQRNGTEESDMEIPEVKDYKPRKQLGIEVIEQEVYGIDPYTHNLLLDSMPEGSNWTLQDKHFFIEDVLLRSLNKQVRNFTGTGNTPMMYPLQPVVEEILKTAEEDHDNRTIQFCECILNAINKRPEDNYVAYRKGLGVVCNKEGGFVNDDFVVEFLGEVYPAWKWFEKQDGIRSLQKNNKDPAPEFYNIYLERPKGDADGYDLVVVDAMHKANYASRICHSCRPNCEAKVTAVDGQYQIGIYAVRPIEYGEEITFDYNSVTESKEEHEASVCLCGSQICRGSYLNLTGEGAFQKVLKDWHGILNRHHLLLEACEINFVSEEDFIDLGRAGLGSCLLGGLPDWLIAYSVRLVRFINFERTKLPQEILRHNLEEKRKFFADISIDVEIEKNEAEVQAEGVYNQRLQNLALTLDKVRYVMRCVFGDPKTAPPPLERLSPEAAVSFLWKGEGSLVDELIRSIAPHMDNGMLSDLKSNIRAHDPSDSDDIQKELRKSLIWLRDEVRNLPCTSKCRHDAAADLIHIYAHTKCFFRVREYKAVTSPPVYISPLDLGPKYTDKMGSGLQEYQKTYGENYCLGQLICWHNQTNNAEPDCSLVIESRGCLSLPEIGSFYVQKPSRQWIYGPSIVKLLLARMEKQPQRPWPEDRIWSFKHSPKIFGSPMLDVVLYNSPLEKEMVHWLKNRPAIFQAPWDR